MKVTVLIGAMGLALGSYSGYHYLYVPKMEQARVIHTQVVHTQADQQARNSAAAVLKQVEEYRKRLPPVPDPSWLVHEAVTLARHTGLELTRIDPQFPQDAAPFTRLTVELQFTATYHQLGMLLDDIERLPFFLRVERLSMHNATDGTEGSAVQLTLVTLYLSPPVKESAAPVTPAFSP